MYFANNMKFTNTFRGDISEHFNVKAGVTYNNQYFTHIQP